MSFLSRLSAAILFLCCWSSILAADRTECRKALAALLSNTAKQPAWYIQRKALQKAWSPEHFSDPRHHNPKSYRYIIHNPANHFDDALAAHKYLIFDDEGYYTISATVIDHTGRVRPWRGGQYGFILKAPEENVMAAAPKDLGVLNYQPKIECPPNLGYVCVDYVMYPEYIFTRGGLMPPDEVLLKTGKAGFNYYNEVAIARVGEKGQRPEITGIYAFEEADLTTLNKAKALAEKLNIPLVTLNGNGAIPK